MLCRAKCMYLLTVRIGSGLKTSHVTRSIRYFSGNKNSVDLFSGHFRTQKQSIINNSIPGFTGIQRHFSLSTCYKCKKPAEGVQDKPNKAENILTVPNLLTTCRIISAPFLGYMITHGHYEMALGLFIVAGITDVLDGYIARNFEGQMSSFGTFLDPLADKVMMTVMYVTLSMANIVPVALTASVVGRDVLLVAAGIYIKYISLKPPITVRNFFDFTNASATLHPSTLSKSDDRLYNSWIWPTVHVEFKSIF
ncbi:cardiolipin synthase (CMP-forming)-like isoform X2 [Ostrea edulis]|uniref:cardiolipin synthase (CMP-forming)-like isoform X2 n=1 Tax=Ostrea edulis TaxID=37623 RepID=UPI0024AEC3BC|nr:cardiolipin synthase (CMP-forming)-like isoform X2 [Ostrea edulis]